MMTNVSTLNRFIISTTGTMSRMNFIPVILIVVFATGCAVTQTGEGNSTRNQERAASMDQVAARIESGNYIFTVQSINPTGGRSIQATTTYTMKVTGGNYEASLPYFGRAYQSSYGGDGGIEFNGTPGDLQITKNTKKNTVTVTFSLKGSKDTYQVSLQVGYSGYGTMTVNSQNRQSISYYGLVSAPQG